MKKKPSLHVVDAPEPRAYLAQLVEYVQALAERGDDLVFDNEAAALHGAIVADLVRLGLDRCADSEAEGVLALTMLKAMGVVSID